MAKAMARMRASYGFGVEPASGRASVGKKDRLGSTAAAGAARLFHRSDIDMRNLARMAGGALGWLLVFDVVGVALTLVVDMIVVLHRRFEGSSVLAYAIWFVVGVYCALFIYLSSFEKHDPDSAEGRRSGSQLVVITAAVALVLALLSSLVWSGSGASEAVAPDHRGVTITYLATVVLTVAWARFALFRERATVERRRTALPRTGGQVRRRAARVLIPSRFARKHDTPDAFKPAGFWQTLGFLIGVPAVLFLDASFFLLAPFDYFDRWMDPLLWGALLGGFAWGFASARRRGPREWLLFAHVPLMIGTLFYLLAVIVGGLLSVFAGVPERVLDIMSYVAFWIGFLVFCAGVVVAGFADLLEHATSSPKAPQ